MKNYIKLFNAGLSNTSERVTLSIAVQQREFLSHRTTTTTKIPTSVFVDSINVFHFNLDTVQT
jgi:hypothetical protein